MLNMPPFSCSIEGEFFWNFAELELAEEEVTLIRQFSSFCIHTSCPQLPKSVFHGPKGAEHPIFLSMR